MSQKSGSTTTTSFIKISSSESLINSSPSFKQSTDSSNCIMVSAESAQSIQYFINQTSGNHDTMSLDQASQQQLHNLSHPNILPPQQPINTTQVTSIYEPSNCATIDNNLTNAYQQQSSQSAMNNGTNQHIDDSLESASMIYGIYNGNQVSPILHSESQTTHITSATCNRSEQLQHYSTGNDWRSLSNNNNSINISTTITQDKQISQKNSPIYVTNSNTQAKSNSVKTFHQNNHSPISRQSINSLDSTSTSSLMPINVKGMLLHGISGNEVLRNWLCSIKSEEYLQNFIDHGYDIYLINKMTPQDLTAIGIKSPSTRKKFLVEIRKLNLEDDIPEVGAHSLEQWLNQLKLSEYHATLCGEGYNTIQRVCELTWEDLEEIGIRKLGHQKRLLIGIENVLKSEKRKEESIYDIRPEHKVTLNPTLSDNRLSTLGRSTVRSGLFQTRSGANLDHRGLPVATVMPALKHVNTSLANMEISQQVVCTNNSKLSNGIENGNNGYSKNSSPSQKNTNMNPPLKMNDLSATMKRNPPPLPPVRTNSLKIPAGDNSVNLNNNIYGNCYSIARNNNGNIDIIPTGPTSYLRTPKLGTLTATTNKMLTSGGHIQAVNNQMNGLRTIVPIREAPLPPNSQQTLSIPENVEEELCMRSSNFNDPSSQIPVGGNSTFVGNQLNNEFPPPPSPTQ